MKMFVTAVCFLFLMRKLLVINFLSRIAFYLIRIKGEIFVAERGFTVNPPIYINPRGVGGSVKPGPC